MIKKFLPVSLVLLSAIFIFTSLSQDKSDIALAEAAVVVNDRPVLPDSPYDYDVDFPQHVANPSSWTRIDTGDFNALIDPDGATLGRVLFYDKKLSFNNQVACASCHIQELAFADDKQFSEGFEQKLSLRNSPNLNDLAWSGTSGFSSGGHQLFWDVRETDFETVALSPIQHEDELNKDLPYMENYLSRIDYYPPLFEKAYGDPEVTAERVGNAIAQFIRSMSVFDSKYDKVKTGQAAFTAQEQQGFDIFRQHCEGVCHGEPNFSTAMALNNGLDDVFEDKGKGEWSGNPADVGRFKSPSLRNIEFTAPYMHDGRFNTLEDVMTYYSEEVNAHPNADFGWVGQGGDFKGFDFDDDEKEALVAFMKTFTSTELLTDAKWSNPFDAASSTEEILNAAVQVFPNPVAESFTVDLSDLPLQEVNLNLHDISGKLVWSTQTMTGSKQSFELGKLNAGIYVLKTKIDGERVSKKIMIK